MRFLRLCIGSFAGIVMGHFVPAHAEDAIEPELIQSRLRLAPTPAQLASWPRWPAVWLLPQMIARDPATQLANLGFSPEVSDAIARRATAVPAADDSAPASVRVAPDLALWQRFSPTERIRWHRLLATHAANLPSRWPIAVTAEDVTEIERLPGGDTVAALIRQTAVPADNGIDWLLHDPWVLNEVLADTPAATRDAALARLLSARAVWAKVQESGSDLATIRAHAAYWQSQGRFRAIEPILQALGAVTDRDRIDLLHLLPRLPRALLNSYPVRLDRSPDPTQDNALATAGFFGHAPSLGDANDFTQWLQETCDPITGPPAFGDAIVFEDIHRTRWPFAAVYVADGVVFGRRPTLSGPWGLWRLDEISVLNPRLGAAAPRVFRPRSADIAALEDFNPLPPPPRWLHPTALQSLPAGPWGELVSYDIFLTPSAALLAALPEPETAPEWRFRRFDRPTRDALLQGPGLSGGQREQLRGLFAAATPAPNSLHVVNPPAELVKSLPASWRSLAYRFLDSSGGATRYFQEIRVIHPLTSADLPPNVADEILPLVYPRNGRFAVGDYGLIYHLARDESDRIATFQTLARTPARIVLLKRPRPEDVPALTTYWEAGGRKDLGLLLEAFAEQTTVDYLDVSHLLPSLPREYMNLFVLPLEDRPMPSCYWTALNFSQAQPDPRFLVVPGTPGDEVAVVENELRTNYRRIARPEHPGDVIAYYDRGDSRAPSHVCSHLAADLVFTKNGFGYDAPWCITRRSDVDELYLQPETGEVRYYRRLPDKTQSASSAK